MALPDWEIVHWLYTWVYFLLVIIVELCILNLVSAFAVSEHVLIWLVIRFNSSKNVFYFTGYAIIEGVIARLPTQWLSAIKAVYSFNSPVIFVLLCLLIVQYTTTSIRTGLVPNFRYTTRCTYFLLSCSDVSTYFQLIYIVDVRLWACKLFMLMRSIEVCKQVNCVRMNHTGSYTWYCFAVAVELCLLLNCVTKM